MSSADPMILALNLRYSRVPDLITPNHLGNTPAIPIKGYRDFGNWR